MSFVFRKFTGFQWIKYEINVPNNISIDLFIELGRKSFREKQQQLQQKKTLARRYLYRQSPSVHRAIQLNFLL